MFAKLLSMCHLALTLSAMLSLFNSFVLYQTGAGCNGCSATIGCGCLVIGIIGSGMSTAVYDGVGLNCIVGASLVSLLLSS